MSIFSNFWKFIQGKLLGGKTYQVSSKDIEDFADSNKWNELYMYEFAVQCGINIIANALSKCEVRTFDKWNEIKGDQYYRWNIEPNRNQNANEFMQKIVWSLIYKNECLIVQDNSGAMLVADQFTHRKYTFEDDTFENVTVCQDDESGVTTPFTFSRKFKMSDVIYYKMNNRNIKLLMDSIASGYQELLETAITKYNKSGGERGIININASAVSANYGTNPDGTTRTFNQVYAEIMNKYFANYFKSPNAVLPLWNGFSYQQTGTEASKKSTSEIKDVFDVQSEIFNKVANALQIPPSILRGDVADVSAVTKNMITFCIEPLADLISTENNRKLYGKEVLNGTYQMIDTTSILHESITDVANAADKMIACGGWSVDEVRSMAGSHQLHTEMSQKHFLTKNYEEMGATRTPTKGEEPT